MGVLNSRLNSRSADFADNAAQMQALVDDLYRVVRKVMDGGGEKASSSRVRVPLQATTAQPPAAVTDRVFYRHRTRRAATANPAQSI